MHFKTFLPAIILAQPSFAYYWCCFEATGTDGSYAEFVKSGYVENWTPGAGCLIEIDKRGPSCKEWKASVYKQCSHFGLTTYGVVTKDHCS
ncbi:hypothetical protein EG328_010418 [Venturia inaequalis]|uniref:Uncharacterized protein n=1 Tax=Venturia inaequalis TaxID=5025 RepID=A0A8H3U5X9_VENIN|nr:hypothetical protein EG328_010418 [Venturia inaequalis]KAE9971476.1 hypothetical protein EG327_009851 [Venturia inaequalis]RDI76869.1 hypothetical protein Vi05172_g13098 [Venturia inaequalis]